LYAMQLVKVGRIKQQSEAYTTCSILMESDFCYLEPTYADFTRPAKVATDDLLEMSMLVNFISTKRSEVTRLRQFGFVIPDSMLQIGIMVGSNFREQQKKAEEEKQGKY
jgi:hypothetical protein